MTDAGSALKDAYYTFLQDLTDEGQIVPVFNGFAPSEIGGVKVVAPYIILNGWQAQPDNTKDSFGQKGEYTLQVFDRMPSALYSELRCDRIANSVTSRLKPTPTAEPLKVAGFTHWSVVNTPLELREPNAVDVVYRKIITIEHSLCQIQ